MVGGGREWRSGGVRKDYIGSVAKTAVFIRS